MYKKLSTVGKRTVGVKRRVRAVFEFYSVKGVIDLEIVDLTLISGVVAGGGGQGARAPSDNFLGALKSKGGDKTRNCQCEVSYKICKVQLVNKFKVVVILAFL